MNFLTAIYEIQSLVITDDLKDHLKELFSNGLISRIAKTVITLQD